MSRPQRKTSPPQRLGTYAACPAPRKAPKKKASAKKAAACPPPVVREPVCPPAKRASSGKKRSRKAGKAVKGVAKRRRHSNSFKTYIFKVLKQVHPDTGVTFKSMETMDNFTHDLLDRMVECATQLAHAEHRGTIQVNDVEAAARLVLHGELAKHAISEGRKAVTFFKNA